MSSPTTAAVDSDCRRRASDMNPSHSSSESSALTLYIRSMYLPRFRSRYPLRCSTGWVRRPSRRRISRARSLPTLPLPSLNGCIASNW